MAAKGARFRLSKYFDTTGGNVDHPVVCDACGGVLVCLLASIKFQAAVCYLNHQQNIAGKGPSRAVTLAPDPNDIGLRRAV